MLYMLYIAELVLLGGKWRFAYADDMLNIRASKTLEENVERIEGDLQRSADWCAQNKIQVAQEKTEAIHLYLGPRRDEPTITVDGTKITPISSSDKKKQAALRWLGFFFDRQLTGRRHVDERAAKALKAARHIRSLANTKHGPPTCALRTAASAIVVSSAMYGAEAWYHGGWRYNRKGELIREKQSKLLQKLDTALSTMARGIIPAWKTYPSNLALQDAGVPSAYIAAEHSRARFAFRLATVDQAHPLVKRQYHTVYERGPKAGQLRPAVTKLLRATSLLPYAPRPVLAAPRYAQDSRNNPTQGKSKEVAARDFESWYSQLSPFDTVVFTDGSEQTIDGKRFVGYGFAVFQNKEVVATGSSAITEKAHVFDAEAIGALRGLQAARELTNGLLYCCVDSTSIIWGLRGNAPFSSQWAFLQFHEICRTTPVEIRWCPGHTDIEGNELADKLAREGARGQIREGEEERPTISHIRSSLRKVMRKARTDWWKAARRKFSAQYLAWETEHHFREPPELRLPRPLLARLLSIRSGHGDFESYHRRFHKNSSVSNACERCSTVVTCACGRLKTPSHFIHCRTTVSQWKQWPDGPNRPPDHAERESYLRNLLNNSELFLSFARTTRCFEESLSLAAST